MATSHLHITVCDLSELKIASARQFEYDGRTFLIYLGPDLRLYATDGHCTHEKALLSDGDVDGFTVECPKHLAQFDYRSGKAIELPACIDLKTHPVLVQDGKVVIELSR
jgi:3-phenylpropionate/trans-cinnamate dioxygenase ferredoxin component